MPTGTSFRLCLLVLLISSPAVAAPVGAAPKGEKAVDARDPDGTWTVSGATPEGKAYSGTATLSRIGGEMYRGSLLSQGLPGGATRLLCFRDGDVLSCGCGPSKDLGVAAYLVREEAPAGTGAAPATVLDGVWFEENHASLGLERLSGGPPSLVGAWTIKSGESPTKAKYAGSVQVEVRSGVYQLSWTVGKRSWRGIGLRSGAVLSAGFNDGDDFGVRQYRFDKTGRVLAGQWARGGKVPGVGVETLGRN